MADKNRISQGDIPSFLQLYLFPLCFPGFELRTKPFGFAPLPIPLSWVPEVELPDVPEEDDPPDGDEPPDGAEVSFVTGAGVPPPGGVPDAPPDGITAGAGWEP